MVRFVHTLTDEYCSSRNCQGMGKYRTLLCFADTIFGIFVTYLLPISNTELAVVVIMGRYDESLSSKEIKIFCVDKKSMPCLSCNFNQNSRVCHTPY